jgi:UDP-N-acetylmuramate dehydrogenase
MLSNAFINQLIVNGCKVLRNELMSKHCSFNIGGPVKFFIEIPNEKSLYLLLKYIKFKNFYILGSGTNVLFPDYGYNGVVITLVGDFKYCSIKQNNVLCGSGSYLNDILKLTLMNNLTGLEFAIGIPGTIGGATFGNAGSSNKWISSVISGIEIYNSSYQKQYIDRKYIHFEYRASNINNCIITKVILQLNKFPFKINYNIQEYIQKRYLTQPIDFPSAGSIFKNPVEISAGKLIEYANLKGFCIGKARISELHGNFIINTGGACAQDVLLLINLIKIKVKKKFNINLETEIKIIK